MGRAGIGRFARTFPAKFAAAGLFTVLAGLGLSGRAKHRAAGTPGQFDYYRLTLSWSPEYCYSHRGDPQCSGARHFGFVAHGFWPEYRNGGWPQYCSPASGLANPSRMLDIMPSSQLIFHEWQRHGSCSGLTATDYFHLLRKAFESIHIPSSLLHPRRQTTISVQEIKALFEHANPGLGASSLAVSCHGRYLSEVAICLSKTLTPVPCAASVNCHEAELEVAPVR